MCTVSYIPTEKGFVLTSNRDEKQARQTIAPQVYQRNGRKLYYPKDVLAGGSWIATNEEGRAVCLLNGGFLPHHKKDTHTHSRGQIVLEAAASTENPIDLFNLDLLQKTEPFTLLTLDYDNKGVVTFNEFIWDGADRHYRLLDLDKEYIWSSVTLYSEEIRRDRKRWFNKFIAQKQSSITPSDLLEFHTGKHTDDDTVNVIMERQGGLKTVSVTQVVGENGSLQMRYYDLLSESKTVLAG